MTFGIVTTAIMFVISLLVFIRNIGLKNTDSDWKFYFSLFGCILFAFLFLIAIIGVIFVIIKKMNKQKMN
jgi:amino acid permease